jgi:aryl-alcohol dehydrogenase-like predicted oxidoreductase
MKPSGARGSCSRQRAGRIDLRIRATNILAVAAALCRRAVMNRTAGVSTQRGNYEVNEAVIMNYRLLGKSGLRVSEFCLGTMTFGEDWGWGSSKDDAKKIYDAFREAGGNFIDTANIYTNGTSESFLGEFLKGHRESVVLATKYTNAAPGTDPNAAGNHRKNMVQAVEASLKRLQTDYIDLYWVHIWDQITPVEEVMRALDDLVRQGKVLYVGISDAPAWWIAQANTLATLRGWSPFVGLQIEYSLIERTVERELIPMAEALNLGVTAWSPLSSGVLTGKYHGHGSSEGARMNSDMVKEFMPEEQRAKRVVAAVKTVADEVGRSMAQVALAWLRYRPVPVIPIIGARKLSQLKDNLASSDVSLSPNQLKTLDEASRIELGFPYEFYTRDLVRGLIYGGMGDRIVA